MANNFAPAHLPNNCNYLIFSPQYFNENCSQLSVLKNQSNTYYLEHSTDTTAMKSFDAATSMTLWIAIFATLLAWWFGKQSFKLTQQAFQQSIEQIQASILAASEHTDAMLNSNKKVIEHQTTIQSNEFNFQKEQEIKKNLINLSTTFFQSGKKIFYILTKYVEQLHPKDWQTFVNYSSLHLSTSSRSNTNYLDSHNSINMEIENMMLCLFEFSMLTNPTNSKVKEAMSDLRKATDLAIEQRDMHKYKDQKEHEEKLILLNTAIQNSRIALIGVIQDKRCFL